MPYSITLDGQTVRIDPGTNGEDRTITLNETSHTLNWRAILPALQGSGHLSVLQAGQSFDIYYRRLPEQEGVSGQRYELVINGKRFEITAEDERTKKLGSLAKQNAHAGTARISAPMPGLVTRIPVAVGDTVSAGQVVAVLEAMKMENDLNAPIAGTVKEVRVQPGQTVDQGQVLVLVVNEQAAEA